LLEYLSLELFAQYILGKYNKTKVSYDLDLISSDIIGILVKISVK